jgi:hypothetical protein
MPGRVPVRVPGSITIPTGSWRHRRGHPSQPCSTTANGHASPRHTSRFGPAKRANRSAITASSSARARARATRQTRAAIPPPTIVIGINMTVSTEHPPATVRFRLGKAACDCPVSHCPVPSYHASALHASVRRWISTPAKRPLQERCSLRQMTESAMTYDADPASHLSPRSASPSRSAYSAAWVRFARCSLLRMFVTWVRTVRSLMNNCSPISWLDNPRAT